MEPKTTYDMARRFAAEIRGNPDAVELRYRFHRGVSQLWLVTAAVDFDEEEQFYELSHMLYGAFSEAAIDFHVVNQALFEPFDIDAIVPRDAEKFPLH